MSKWGYAACGWLVLVSAGTAVWMGARLDAERAAHEATRTALEQAVTACEQTEQRAEALRKALIEAHAREATWTEEEAARAEIVGKARSEPRPPEEKDRVGDDATRRAAVSRLNMAW